MSIRILVELVITGDAADALYVANEVLDDGIFQTAFNEHEYDAGPLGVESAIVHIVDSEPCVFCNGDTANPKGEHCRSCGAV